MRIGKRIVGTFHSEQDLLYAIEGLKRQGYRETDMMVVARNRSDIPLVNDRTGVMVEADMQVSTLAGVMMDSLFTVMTGGMGGNHASILAERLTERDIPEFTAKHCEAEVNKGKMVLLIDTDIADNSSVYEQMSETPYETEEQKAVRLREEQLNITKERVQIGELQLRKEVIEEQRTIHVPLIREEVYVERRPVTDGKYDGSPITGEETIRVPITEERIKVTKRPVVVEEVVVGKRKVQETKQVQDTIRKEEARIERSGVPIKEEAQKGTYYLKDVERQEVFMENSNLPAVQEDPSLATLTTDDKKDEASGMLTDSPDREASESESYVPISAATMKDEGNLSGENSSGDEANKNNKIQSNKKKK
ncbi:uncharacterized protein (TIGR02271 family) [Bacillus fengqiuensis]|nr:uncharacterized protein (TIGR02271 family) [Bacillus fengqiuensis]